VAASVNFPLSLLVVAVGRLPSRGGLMPVTVGSAKLAPRYSGIIFVGFLGALFIISCLFGIIS